MDRVTALEAVEAAEIELAAAELELARELEAEAGQEAPARPRLRLLQGGRAPDAGA